MIRIITQHKYYLLLLLFVVGGVVFLVTNQVSGATYTWDNSSGDGLWSTCTNWSTDVCPTSADIAQFTSASTSDSVLDSGFAGSVAGVSIVSGYTGTITQQKNLAIGASGFSQDGGTWKQSTTSFSILNASFALSNGTFETGVSTSTVNRDYTLSGGTYTASSSSAIVFDGNTDNTTLTCTGQFPGVIDLAKTNGGSFTLASGCEATTTAGVSTQSNAVTVNGILHIAGTFDGTNTNFTNNGTTTVGTSMNVEQNFTQNGVMDLTGKTVTFDGGGDNTTLTCTGQLGGVIGIAKSGGGDFTLASGCEATTTATVTTSSGNITVNGILHIPETLNSTSNGSFTNNGTTTLGTSITLERDFTQNGVMDLTGNTIIFDGGGDNSILTCTGDLGADYIDVAKTSSGSFTLSSACSVLATTITTSGPLIIEGILATEGNTLTGTSLTINGTVRLYGDETITSPTLGDNSVLDYYGPGTYTSLGGITDFENISFSGGGTYNLTGTYTVEDDFLSSGDSNFNQTSGAVTFDGTNQTITGSSTFNNFTKAPSGKATLTFGANSTTTVKGTATLTGNTIDNYLTITSDAPGASVQWNFDPQGSRSFTNLWVRDSNNIDATIASCTDCRGLGNNTNWDLPDPRQIWRINGDTRMQGDVRVGQ